MLCWRLQSHSVHSTHRYTALSPGSGELTSRIENVRKEWRSSHLSNSPAASFLFPPVTLAHCNPGRMSTSAMQCYFPRLWDGGEKHINKRISVIVLALGGKWSILWAAVIRFCGSQKGFSVSFWYFFWVDRIISVSNIVPFLVWKSKSHMYSALLHSVNVCVLVQTRLLDSRAEHLSGFPSASEMIQNPS